MVGTSPSNVGGAALIPGWGAGIPHDSQPKSQNMGQKWCRDKFKKDFGEWSTSKKRKKIFKKEKKTLDLTDMLDQINLADI